MLTKGMASLVVLSNTLPLMLTCAKTNCDKHIKNKKYLIAYFVKNLFITFGPTFGLIQK
jgi:hypothetical protein